MTRHHARRRLPLARSLAVWAILLALAWIDRGGSRIGTHADIFSWLLGAFGAIADAAEFVVSGVEMALSAAVGWLVTSVGWIVARLGDIVVSTGSIFAKTWDALKALWVNVVEPVIWQLDQWAERFYRWLSNLIAPVLRWAQIVRDELTAIYRRFVRPILDALQTASAILGVLADLHVPFAAALERYTNDLENWITEGYLRLSGYVNRILDTLDGLLTFDGLLQRFVFLRTVERDWYLMQRAMLNPMFAKLTDKQSYRLTVAWEPQPAPDLHAALGDYLAGGSNDTGAVIDATADAGLAYWNTIDGSESA